MNLILAIIFSILFGFIFWFIGHIAKKLLNLKEDNHLLDHLINIAIGSTGFLTLTNFISFVLRDFNLGLIISFLFVFLVIGWQFKEFSQIVSYLVANCKTISADIKKGTNKYFWILFGVINFTYGLIAFSTTKINRFGLVDMHVYNVNQLIAGTYPPKYSFLPNLTQKYHYGADIFTALISKFSNLHPEISMDILTLIFLNLSLLAFYGLTMKFIGSKETNKYIVPGAAFLAWGPITSLFNKNPGETIPQNLLEKIIYLSQLKLTDAANWSGAVINWFFDPPTGFSIFFFLILLYLLCRFFNGERELKFIALISVLLSSFVILDITKFILISFGMILYLLFTSIDFIAENSSFDKFDRTKQLTWLKNLGLFFLIVIILSVINQNWFNWSNKEISLISFYKLGTINFNPNLTIKPNLILLLIYGFGFYQAWKLKQTWVSFLIPFFAAGLIIPFLGNFPMAATSKIMLSANLLGAFTLPYTLDFLHKKLELDTNTNKLKAFYSLTCIILTTSTLMFLFFGDKNPILRLENGKLHYIGIQKLLFSDDPHQEESLFIKELKRRNIKDKAIITEPIYGELFSTNTGLYNLNLPNDLPNIPIKKEIMELSRKNYHDSLLLEKKFLTEQKVNWLYITQPIFMSLSPQTRTVLLDSYLNNGAKLALSNQKTEDPSNLKELYELTPKLFSTLLSESNFNLQNKFLKSFKKSKDHPLYLKEIALCPYLGSYNAMSNDFNGDMIADLAFFDPANHKWIIVNSRDGTEEEIDLNQNILQNYNGTDYLLPVPSDYDGDSKTDIALFNKTNSRWLILNSSDSIINSSKTWCWGAGEIPLAADIDGDLKADPTCYNYFENRFPSIVSSFNYTYRDSSFNGIPSDIPTLSDIDGDKKDDYIVYRTSQHRFYVYLSTKNYNNPIQVTLGEESSRVVPEDYDGDGKVDLATWTPKGGKWEIAYAKDFLVGNNNAVNTTEPFIGCGVPQNTNDNNIIVCSTFTKKLGGSGNIPIPADYDGDRKADIAIYSPKSSKAIILLSTGGRKDIDLSKYKNLIPANFIGI